MPTIQQPSTIGYIPLIIVGTTTYIFQIGEGQLGDEDLEVENETDRPPYGDKTTWFRVGDGMFNPSKLQVIATINRATYEAATAELNLLMVASRLATKIIFGVREREVFGLGKPLVLQRLPGGYRVDLTFLPKSVTWINTATNTEEWA